MKNFFPKLRDFILLLLTAVAVLAVIGVIGLYAYYWFTGIFTGLNELIGVGWIISLIIIVITVATFGGLGVLIMAGIGTYGATIAFGFPWYGALALYLPTAAFWLGASILAMSVFIGAWFLETLGEMFKRR